MTTEWKWAPYEDGRARRLVQARCKNCEKVLPMPDRPTEAVCPFCGCASVHIEFQGVMGCLSRIA